MTRKTILVVVGATLWAFSSASGQGGVEEPDDSELAPVVEPICQLAPDLAEIKERCTKDAENPGPVACAQLRVLELVANGMNQEAEEILVRELELPEESAARLMPLFHMLAMMAIADEPSVCFERQAQGIMKLFSRPENLYALMSYENLAFLHQLVTFYPDALVAKVEEVFDPTTARKLRSAGQALADLFESTSAGEQLERALENNPLLLMMSSEWLASRHVVAEPPPGDPSAAAGNDMLTINEILGLVGAGRLPEAREALVEARQAVAANPVREGKLALNAGAVFALLGQLEDAAALLQQADELLASVPEDEEAQRTRNLGTWFRIMALEEIGLSTQTEGVVKEAQNRDDFFAMVLGGVRPFFRSPPSESADFQQLADTFQALSTLLFSPDRDLEDLDTTMGAMEKALPWLTSSVNTGGSETPRPYFAILLELFEHAVEGRPEGSLRAVEELLEHYPRYQNAWFLALIAIQYWKAGEPQQALDVCRRSIEVLESEVEDFRVDETLTTFFGGRGFALYQLAVELTSRLGHHAEAFAYAERGRAWTLRRLLGSPRPSREESARLEDDPGAQELLTTLDGLEHELRSASTEAEKERLRTNLAQVRTDYETLRLRSKLDAPETSGLAQVTPVQLDRLQHDLLKDDGALVAYFPGLGDDSKSGGRLWVWVVDREDVFATVLSMTDEIRRQVACEIRELRSRDAPPRARRAAATRGVELLSGCDVGDEDPAVALHRRFLQPVMDRLRHDRHLVVVPHGILHYVPFAALRDSATGRYLVEDFTLSLAPSVSALDQLASRSGNVGGEVLVMGDPRTDLGDLSGARQEAKAVAHFLRTKALLGKQATEAAVYERSGGLGLLHLAAHGEYVPGHPLFSRIVLGAGGRHDGALTVHEVWDRLDLGGTQLVALSGCEAALGDLTAGDEVIGLTQGFLVAGSRAVLSTLWPVDDKASSRLAIAFYERLLAGAPAAEALRSAQLEMIAARDHNAPYYTAPYYWAGYTLTGDSDARWQPATSAPPSADASPMQP